MTLSLRSHIVCFNNINPLQYLSIGFHCFPSMAESFSKNPLTPFPRISSLSLYFNQKHNIYQSHALNTLSTLSPTKQPLVQVAITTLLFFVRFCSGYLPGVKLSHKVLKSLSGSQCTVQINTSTAAALESSDLTQLESKELNQLHVVGAL